MNSILRIGHKALRVFTGLPSFGGLVATLAGLFLKVADPVQDSGKKVSLGFDNMVQGWGFALINQRLEAMPPPQGCVSVNATRLCARSNREAVLDTSCELVPLFLLPETGQGSAGQSIESLSTLLTTEPFEAISLAPLTNGGATTVRAPWFISHPSFNFRNDSRCFSIWITKTFQQRVPLSLSQLGQVDWKRLAFSVSHESHSKSLLGRGGISAPGAVIPSR